ncbi:hypothetical protein AB3331_05805 [Streptococcus sp. H49]|uniref:hypothetical protein n=1 Tax=Streptococcus huangxiaojuni TaxID=3237239 RepID=UPI0034A54C90
MRNWLIDKENAKYKAEQDRMVSYLVQHYEGIEKVEFGEFIKNDITGSQTTVVKINNVNIIHVTFYDFKSDKYVIGWDPKTFDMKEKDSSTSSTEKSGVEIIYWERN